MANGIFPSVEVRNEMKVNIFNLLLNFIFIPDAKLSTTISSKPSSATSEPGLQELAPSAAAAVV